MREYKKLLENNFSVDSQLNDIGQTAFMLFIMKGNSEGITLVLEEGGTITPIDKSGRNAIHYIAQIEGGGPVI